MAAQARRLAAAAAAFAACVSFPVFSSVGVANAETCLAAPGAAGPKGSRWYYRLEWPSQRKCWHLVLSDKRPTRAAKAAPAPQVVADDDTEEATPAPAKPVAATPVASTAPVRIAQPEQRPAQVPPAGGWITRNVSNTEETPVQPDPAAAVPPAEAAPAPVQRLEAPPVAVAPQPVAATRAPAQAANPDGALSTWRLMFAAIALLGFAAAGALVLLEMRRRRTDVLNTMTQSDAAPEDWHESRPAEDAPTFAPLPPMAVHRGDDVDEAMRHFLQNRRRRAA